MKRIPFILFVSLLCVVASQAGDRRRAPVSVRPTGMPKALKPKTQTEGHTCGFHAMEAIYESYGLKPANFRLRARLGVDRPAVPFKGDTTGSVHPDILRVFDQDGFKAELLKMGNEYSKEKLINHLWCGYDAMTLIKLKPGDALHWVVITDFKDGQVSVADSLQSEAIYKKPMNTYAKEQMLSVLLVSPKQKPKENSIGKSHRSGLWEMIKSWWRM